MMKKRSDADLGPTEEALEADVEPEREAPPPRRMIVEPIVEDDGAGEVLLATDMLDDKTIPLFEGVKVVYVGHDPHHAPVLRGRVTQQVLGGARKETRGPEGQLFIEMVGAELVEQASPRFNTSYDFRARDNAGRKSARRMPLIHPIVEVRDRPYQSVRHANHVYWFARRPQEYRLVVEGQAKFAVREYIARRERARKLHQQFLEQATAGAGR